MAHRRRARPDVRRRGRRRPGAVAMGRPAPRCVDAGPVRERLAPPLRGHRPVRRRAVPARSGSRARPHDADRATVARPAGDRRSDDSEHVPVLRVLLHHHADRGAGDAADRHPAASGGVGRSGLLHAGHLDHDRPHALLRPGADRLFPGGLPPRPALLIRQAAGRVGRGGPGAPGQLPADRNLGRQVGRARQRDVDAPQSSVRDDGSRADAGRVDRRETSRPRGPSHAAGRAAARVADPAHADREADHDALPLRHGIDRRPEQPGRRPATADLRGPHLLSDRAGAAACRRHWRSAPRRRADVTSGRHDHGGGSALQHLHVPVLSLRGLRVDRRDRLRVDRRAGERRRLRIARRRRASPAALLAIAQISGAIVLSIFVNKFNNTASWYILFTSLLPFLVGGYLRTRRPASAVAR